MLTTLLWLLIHYQQQKSDRSISHFGKGALLIIASHLRSYFNKNLSNFEIALANSDGLHIPKWIKTLEIHQSFKTRTRSLLSMRSGISPEGHVVTNVLKGTGTVPWCRMEIVTCVTCFSSFSLPGYSLPLWLNMLRKVPRNNILVASY